MKTADIKQGGLYALSSEHRMEVRHGSVVLLQPAVQVEILDPKYKETYEETRARGRYGEANCTVKVRVAEVPEGYHDRKYEVGQVVVVPPRRILTTWQERLELQQEHEETKARWAREAAERLAVNPGKAADYTRRLEALGLDAFIKVSVDPLGRLQVRTHAYSIDRLDSVLDGLEAKLTHDRKGS